MSENGECLYSLCAKDEAMKKRHPVHVWTATFVVFDKMKMCRRLLVEWRHPPAPLHLNITAAITAAPAAARDAVIKFYSYRRIEQMTKWKLRFIFLTENGKFRFEFPYMVMMMIVVVVVLVVVDEGTVLVIHLLEGHAFHHRTNKQTNKSRKETYTRIHTHNAHRAKNKLNVCGERISKRERNEKKMRNLFIVCDTIQ